ncbi:MAG: ABC transporter substrate-binding protein [Halobacteriota archaeon]
MIRDDSELSRHPTDSSLTRRALLATGGTAGLFVLAGCTDSGGGSDGGGSGSPGEPVGPLTLEVGQLTNFPDVTREVARQWGELGVEFELKSATWGPYVPRVYVDNEYEEAAHMPWGSSPDRIDPDFFLSTYTSESSLNISGYENERYDEVFAAQRRAYDPEERDEHIRELQTILREDLPEITVVWPKAALPVNSGQWDISPTKFIGARTTGTMTVLTAEPTGDASRLVVGAQQEISAPNPLAPGSNDVQYLFKLAYDTPRRIGLDGDPVDWAVESFETVDETTIDMTLREGMTFHDGEPVTGEDLRFTFDFLTEYEFPKFDPFLEGVERTELQTDRTVRVTLDQPNVAFLTSAMTFMNILPKHVWESVPDEVDQPVNWNASVDDLVGSGPLKITDISSSEIIYEAFDDHFAPVAYDEFVFVNRASMEAIRADFEAQNVHLTTSSPPPSITNELASNDYISKSTAASVLQMKFSFDLSSKPFDDLAFRRALLQATDAQKIADIFYDGEANLADGTLVHPELSWGRDDLSTLSADVDAAKSVLTEAGYTYDDDGRLHYPA